MSSSNNELENLRARPGHRSKRATVGVLLVGSAAWLLASACGSKTSEGPSGISAGNSGISAGAGGATAGTPGSAGTSGATSSALCTPGDTRTCVGPGACPGGQACGSDQTWTACDCGGQGGSGPSGTAGSAGGALAEGGAAGSSEAGAGGTSGFGAGDEPCPAEAIDTDCSGQCGPKSAACVGDDTCLQVIPGGSQLVEPLHLVDGVVFARLPSHPGNRCAACTVGTTSAYAVGINIANPSSYSPPKRVSSVLRRGFRVSMSGCW